VILLSSIFLALKATKLISIYGNIYLLPNTIDVQYRQLLQTFDDSLNVMLSHGNSVDITVYAIWTDYSQGCVRLISIVVM